MVPILRGTFMPLLAARRMDPGRWQAQARQPRSFGSCPVQRPSCAPRASPRSRGRVVPPRPMTGPHGHQVLRATAAANRSKSAKGSPVRAKTIPCDEHDLQVDIAVDALHAESHRTEDDRQLQLRMAGQHLLHRLDQRATRHAAMVVPGPSHSNGRRIRSAGSRPCRAGSTRRRARRESRRAGGCDARARGARARSGRRQRRAGAPAPRARRQRRVRERGRRPRTPATGWRRRCATRTPPAAPDPRRTATRGRPRYRGGSPPAASRGCAGSPSRVDSSLSGILTRSGRSGAALRRRPGSARPARTAPAC